MAYLKAAEVRSFNAQDRAARLKDLRQELMHERGVAAMGGSPPSPGKIRQLRRQIARILTIEREDALGIKKSRSKASPGARAPSAPASAASTAKPKKSTPKEE